MPTPKEANLAYFESVLPDLLKDPLKWHKFVVIHGQAVQDVRDTFEGALKAALSRFPSDEFVIQQVVGKDEVINFVMAAG